MQAAAPRREAAPLLGALGIAVWELRDGELVPGGPAPAWLPAEATTRESLLGCFPALEPFLAEADAFWSSGEAGRLASDSWVQPGDESVWQAWAVNVDGASWLAIESLNERHAGRIRQIQHGRQTSLMAELIDRRSRKLERASQRKTEFMARLSHELRTPLNAIIGFATLLNEQDVGAMNERQLQFTREVLDAGHHLLSVINEILDLSRIDSGALTLHVAPFAVGPALAEGAASVRILARQRHIRVNVPDPPPDWTLSADRLRFKQVLINLLANAIRFSSPGSAVDIRATLEDGRLRVEVEDHGIGIPEADQPRIFGEFFQASNHRGEQGTGLGLAIAKRLVEHHGGAIGFASMVGRGSTFWFTLPL